MTSPKPSRVPKTAQEIRDLTETIEPLVSGFVATEIAEVFCRIIFSMGYSYAVENGPKVVVLTDEATIQNLLAPLPATEEEIEVETTATNNSKLVN